MPPSSEFGHSGAVPINPGFGVGGMPSIGEVGMKTRRTRSVFSKVKLVVLSVRDIYLRGAKNFRNHSLTMTWDVGKLEGAGSLSFGVFL